MVLLGVLTATGQLLRRAKDPVGPIGIDPKFVYIIALTDP
jgi:hypothetical protein